jgi:uncharacterized cupredoxin-like copper-binding protein
MTSSDGLKSQLITAPGLFGGVESPLAFKDGVIYVAALNYPMEYFEEGFSFAFDSATADIIAIDAATGQIIWNVDVPSAVSGSGPTIANDLLFVGSLDGLVRAYALADGSLVWTSQTAAGINAPFAITGDTLLVPSAAFIFASADTVGDLPEYKAELIAYRIGAVEAATPVPAEEATAEAATAPGAGLSVEMVDIAFKPTELTIPANTDTVLNLTNSGAAVHNFTIDNPAVTSGDYTPGQTGTLTLNLPAGTYQYYCSIPGHKEAGMVGTLTVQ